MIDTQFEHKGYFWIPENPNQQLAGILKFSQPEGIVLDLFGHFDKYVNPYSKETNIIIGTTSSGKQVTLHNCFEQSRNMGIPGFEVSSINSINLFIGHHFQSVEEISFSELQVSYGAINDWLDISGFEMPEVDKIKKEIMVKYKRPDDIVFEINDAWKLNIQFNYFAPLGFFQPLDKIEIRQAPEIIFKPSTNETFEKFRDQFHVFNSFLSVCYFSYPHAQNLEFYINDEADPKESKIIEWYFKHGINFDKFRKHKSRHDFLLTYKDILPNSDRFIEKWYNLFNKISASINILTEEFMSRSNNIEFRFLGLTQALESFHQRTIGGKVDFIKRIEGIIESLPSIIKRELLRGETDFPRKIRNNRNFLTHYDERLENQIATLGELFKITERLKIILITVILQELGVDDAVIEELIISKGIFLFNHIIKYANVEQDIKVWNSKKQKQCKT